MKLAADRAERLRQAAEVGIRISALQPHTVHVMPDELAAALDDRSDLIAENASLKAGIEEQAVEISVLRRHLSEKEKAIADMRATMVATGRRSR